MLKTTSNPADIQPGDVIYFTASWCAPCKALKPQYGRASVLDADRVYHILDVEELNASEDGISLMNKYGISSIPKIFVVGEDAEITARTAQAIVEEVRHMR